MLVFRRITLVLSILMIPLCWGCDNSGSNPDSQGGIEYAGIEFLGNGNDGGDLPASLNPEMGEKVIIPGNSGGLRKDGYSFTGWNTKEDGSGTSFHEGDIFVAKNNPELLIYGSDLLLYAQWSNLSPPPATYSVTYDGNGYTGGKVPVDSTKYLYNQQGEVKGNTGGLVREHFIFIGWNTDQDGKGISYPIDDEGSIDSNNSTFTIDESDLVLYAQWKHVYCYKICYKSDYDNSVPVDYNIYYYGEQCRVKAEDDYGLVQFGIRYKFLGWRILGSSENRLYMPGDYIRVQSNVVFTAEYSAVGGRGPASGLVFFDKGVYTDGWRFLEVALTNQGSSVMWHNSHGSLNLGVSLEAGIGFGKSNTTAIINALGAENAPAANLCDALNCNGYTDWFLPSIDELRLLESFDGFTDSGCYWSSSDNSGMPYLYNSNLPLESVAYPDFMCKVRAIRRF